MTEYAVGVDTTPPADLSGTAISHLEVRWQLTAAWDDELTAATAAESIAVNLGGPPLTVGQVEGSSR